MTLISSTSGSDAVYLTTESDAAPLIPEEVSAQIMSGVVENSVAMKLFDRLPNMSARTLRMPVLTTLGNADFTSTTTDDDLSSGTDSTPSASSANTGAPGLKTTHEMEWDNVYINAETLAVILPVPDDVVDDADYPIWDAMLPRINEALANKFDAASIFGQGRPTSWPSGIVPTAISRGQVVAEGTGADLAIDFSNAMGILEELGYNPDGFMAYPSLKAKLRNLRDGDGNLIFTPGLQKAPDAIYGNPVEYLKNGAFSSTAALAIAGDMKQAKYAIRQDITYQIFDQGVITNSSGDVVLNLMQQDSKAMRVVMRIGWAVPNPIHALNSDRAGYPFAVITPSASS